MCPYLRDGKASKYCTAYLGYLMEPSRYEQEYFCGTCSYTLCVWYLSKKNEGVDSGALCPMVVESLIGAPETADTHSLMD